MALAMEVANDETLKPEVRAHAVTVMTGAASRSSKHNQLIWKVFPVLDDFIRKGPPAVQAAAIRASHFSNERCLTVDTLLGLAESSEPEVRAAAVECMATAARDDESVTPALLVESLQTGTSPIPVHGDERTWPAIKRAILDPDRKVRDAAARAAQDDRRLMIDCLAMADLVGCRMLLYGSDRT